ncbi:MAG: dephospho-CoA kinase [Opitutaceae bacterium]
MILGITGGLGCGKSTAARLFEQRNFRRIDSDALVRERVLTSASVLAALRVHFADSIFREDGAIDRAALAARVFGDDEERRWLEALTHPLVFALWRDLLSADKAANWVVEVPLLFEQALENWFDFTVCVACSPELQLVRLEQRGLPRSLAGPRISKQFPLARKIELSDFVLWNDGSAAFLQDEVDHLTGSLPAKR